MPRYIIRFDAAVTTEADAPLPDGHVLADPGAGGVLAGEPAGTWRYGRIDIDSGSVTVIPGETGALPPTAITFTPGWVSVNGTEEFPVALTTLSADGGTPQAWSLSAGSEYFSIDTSGAAPVLELHTMPPDGDVPATVTVGNSAGSISATFIMRAGAVDAPTAIGATPPVTTVAENEELPLTVALISADGTKPLDWSVTAGGAYYSVDTTGPDVKLVMHTMPPLGDAIATVQASNDGGSATRDFTTTVEAAAPAPSTVAKPIIMRDNPAQSKATLDLTGTADVPRLVMAAWGFRDDMLEYKFILRGAITGGAASNTLAIQTWTSDFGKVRASITSINAGTLRTDNVYPGGNYFAGDRFLWLWTAEAGQPVRAYGSLNGVTQNQGEAGSAIPAGSTIRVETAALKINNNWNGVRDRIAIWSPDALPDFTDPVVWADFVDADGNMKDPSLADARLGTPLLDDRGTAAQFNAGQHFGSWNAGVFTVTAAAEDYIAPTYPTAAEIQTYVDDVKATADPEAHPDDNGKMTEHAALLALVPRSESTHVAVFDGDWTDPKCWYLKAVPVAGAKVIIPSDRTIRYDADSTEELARLRIDGVLNFATSINTNLVVETMVVAPSGTLTIGTAETPVEPTVTANILIKGLGPIDVAYDPMLMSRALLSHGTATIHGAEKLPFSKVAASTAPIAGATTVDLEQAPTGWRVDDTLVITGTRLRGWSQNSSGVVYLPTDDEIVTITAISGSTVTFTPALTFGHEAPRADLRAYVANTTRNVTIEGYTYDINPAEGTPMPPSERGHVMFMHSDKVNIRYAAFNKLGRTSKSEDAFDIDAIATVTSTSNIKGRYSLHLHKTGDDAALQPAEVVGCSATDSPGWGFVHHSSHADFYDNVALDIFGSAFAAEDGGETGTWGRNIAIRGKGISGGGEVVSKEKASVQRHDNGRSGAGYFFAGRLVGVEDCVAANCTNGFEWMHRSAPTAPLAANYRHPEISRGQPTIPVNRTTIEGFFRNEAFGARWGLLVTKAGPAQNHDLRTTFNTFKAWEVWAGGRLAYTGHYTMIDFDLLRAAVNSANLPAQPGWSYGINTIDMTVNRMTISGFPTAIEAKHSYTVTTPKEDVRHNFIDVTYEGATVEIEGFDPIAHNVMAGTALVAGRLSLEFLGEATASTGATYFMPANKTDSIGTIARDMSYDVFKLTQTDIRNMIKQDGFYVEPDDTRWFIIPDFVSDRADGTDLRYDHRVQLTNTVTNLESLPAVNNGPLPPP